VLVTVGATLCHPTINEVQAGAAGNAADEWVELYNGCTVDIDVSNWVLVYRAATLTASDISLQVLAGTSPAGQFRLYASSAASAAILAIADGTQWSGGTGVLGGTNGSVALRVVAAGTIVDSVAYGAVPGGHPFIEGTPAVAAVNNKSLYRAPIDGRDTNSNNLDFLQSATGVTTPKTTNFP
jgi:hypothetical protein